MNIKEKAKAYSLSIAQSKERQKYCEEDFTAGSEWAIDEICAWIGEHYYDDIYQFRDNDGPWTDIDEVLLDLQQYMKGGEQ